MILEKSFRIYGIGGVGIRKNRNWFSGKNGSETQEKSGITSVIIVLLLWAECSMMTIRRLI